jgi:cytochrome c oxidase subunit 1/cytochrome c oxidase subunit I+III
MLLVTGKETVGTTALDAEPDIILEMPKDSFAPLLLAVGLCVLFIGMLLKTWSIAAPGIAIAGISLLLWLWPRRDLRERELSHG